VTGRAAEEGRPAGSAGPVLFLGGRILTMDPSRPEAGAAVVAGDRILAVGDVGMAGRFADGAVVDLAGRTLVPGFIDAHNHLSIAALHPRWRDVGGARSLEDLLGEVRTQAAAEPDAVWVRVAGWDDALHGLTVRARDLDGLELDRPVVVAHRSLHQGVVNGLGLAELGIGRSTPDPAGGEIGRGPDGEPTGVLLERAWSDAHRRSMAAYADPDRWAEHIAVRARQLLALGVTAVHDAACSPPAEAVYGRMAAASQLPLSVLVMPHPSALLTHEFGGRLDGPPTGEGDEWLRVGPSKLFADGGIAIGLDVSIGGRPIRLGLTMDDLGAVALAAAVRGWRLAVHAIGNVGVDRALDAFTAVTQHHPGADHRFRVEHALVTSALQRGTMASVGAVAVVQPGFVEHVGAQSAGVRFDHHQWLAFAGLLEAGVPLAASSDDPCAPVPPLWCAHKGATRMTDAGTPLEAEQAVPLEGWLRAYTAGAAYAGGQEAERGSITPGKRADLVILDGPLGDGDTPVVAETWVAGRRVHPA